jgi:hypothetical protein
MTENAQAMPELKDLPTPETLKEAIETGKELKAPVFSPDQLNMLLQQERNTRARICHKEVMDTLQKHRCKLDVQCLITQDGTRLDARIIPET